MFPTRRVSVTWPVEFTLGFHQLILWTVMTLPFNLQLIDEKEDYQTDYPYWSIMNMHWLMGHKFFLFPAQLKLSTWPPLLSWCILGDCFVSIRNFQILWCSIMTPPELCTKFKLWATSFCTWLLNVILHLQIARCQGQMFHLWPTSDRTTLTLLDPMGLLDPLYPPGPLGSSWT